MSAISRSEKSVNRSICVMVMSAFQDHQVFKCYKSFDEVVEDEPRSGRLSTSTTDKNFAQNQRAYTYESSIDSMRLC